MGSLHYLLTPHQNKCYRITWDNPTGLFQGLKDCKTYLVDHCFNLSKERYLREKNPFSLALLDLFNDLNDTILETEADESLRLFFVQRLKEAIAKFSDESALWHTLNPTPHRDEPSYALLDGAFNHEPFNTRFSMHVQQLLKSHTT
ncbi:MAG: hypothetical protein AB7F28_07420 [Candidatus Margulisiibacteriota bacterium]